MGNLDGELRRASRELKSLIQNARARIAIGNELDQSSCHALRSLIAEIDELLILGANAPGAPKTLAEAITLLEQCDPDAQLRAIKLDYIDRLASTCDYLMVAGEMPEQGYLRALGMAVADFESHHCIRADADQLTFAWDILAQAEAGIEAATDETHYARARHRYGRGAPVHAEAPTLVLVGGTAV